MDALLSGLYALADPSLLALIFAATLGEMLVGALLGLNATTGVALLLPFTITMDPIPAIAIPAIAIVVTIYCPATFAGAITAILIKPPVLSTSATTCLDGYSTARRDEDGRALGMATVSSTIAGVTSIVCLMAAVPLMARAACNFALTVLCRSMPATIGGGSPIKNVVAGAFGVLLATVGVDLLATLERFTFGFNKASEGIGFVPVMIGNFGISELLSNRGRPCSPNRPNAPLPSSGPCCR